MPLPLIAGAALAAMALAKGISAASQAARIRKSMEKSMRELRADKHGSSQQQMLQEMTPGMRVAEAGVRGNEAELRRYAASTGGFGRSPYATDVLGKIHRIKQEGRTSEAVAAANRSQEKAQTAATDLRELRHIYASTPKPVEAFFTGIEPTVETLATQGVKLPSSGADPLADVYSEAEEMQARTAGQTGMLDREASPSLGDVYAQGLQAQRTQYHLAGSQPAFYTPQQ